MGVVYSGALILVRAYSGGRWWVSGFWFMVIVVGGCGL